MPIYALFIYDFIAYYCLVYNLFFARKFLRADFLGRHFRTTMLKFLTDPKGSIKDDVLSGLTVALALVPEAVAFAFVAGVDPLVGLYAAFLIGLITSLFGGRPGMISGATGALAVVMVDLVSDHGVEFLFATVVLMGVIQVLAGVFKLGKFARLIPHPVMFGFVNGLAIVIFLAQLSAFKNKLPGGELDWMQGAQLYTMLGLTLLTMAIIHFLPKLTKTVPSSLVAIVAVTLISLFGVDTKTVGDIASVAGGFPAFHVPQMALSVDNLRLILPYALILAAIGLIESLLTLTLIDEITQTRGRSNRECIGQGAANIVTGFFGGMGGCAMIGQSMININSGGRGRLSGLIGALGLLVFIVAASGLIEKVPMAALTGVMFMVVIGTFEWSSFRVMRQIPKSDSIVIVAVSVVTVFSDLAIAVGVGIVISALVFAWKSAKKMTLRESSGANGEKVLTIEGHLFFASTTAFKQLFDPKNDPDEVYLDFKETIVHDHSGLDAIHSVSERYKAVGKRLHLVHLSPDCELLLEKAGDLVEVNVLEDPKYHVALDELA
jgi:SulP family sulfate permease